MNEVSRCAVLRSVLILIFVWIPLGFGQGSQTRFTPDVENQLQVMGFKLGKSTLADVQTKLGKSSVRKCSHDEEGSNEVCYVSSGGDQTKVIFEAGFSGSWKELDGYKVISAGVDIPCYRQCTRAAQINSNVHTEGGLKLGLTREQVIALLGRPKELRGDKLIFQWQRRQKMTSQQREAEAKTFKSPVNDPYYDVQDTIKVTIAKLKVVEFEISHIVTY